MCKRNGGWFELIPLVAGLALSMGCSSSSLELRSPPASETKAQAVTSSNLAVANPPPAITQQQAPAAGAKPLLLDNGPAEEEDSGGADNSRCQVCHINFMAEELTRVHAKAQVGCAQCHGKSDAHIADESWASGGNGTPPDIMFPKPKINPFCLGCHPRSKIDNDAHKDFFSQAEGKSLCVDCHGQHRMASRKCKWK